VNKREVAAYLDSTRAIEGWFFPVDALLFALIDEIQRREGIAGNLFEIGVHHGKTALFLARMVADAEILGVCDLFEQQDLNFDRSGEGSRLLFERHMREAALLEPARVRVFSFPSRHLTVDQTTDRCRFFHIDGGHRPEDVFNDLEVADRALTTEGVIAVDDVFNPSWPGVSEGFYRYIRERPETFVPIVIGGNKVLLSRPSAASRYEAHWADPADCQESVDPQPFTLGFKDWMGRRVLTAMRDTWVDLDPAGAAAAHTRVT
jgi:hypothetical protein